MVTWSLYEMRSILQLHLISLACILLWSSAVRVHDSQAYRKMDMTRERISRILELREILLSFQTGFSLVNAATLQDSTDNSELTYLMTKRPDLGPIWLVGNWIFMSHQPHKITQDFKLEFVLKEQQSRVQLGCLTGFAVGKIFAL